LDDNEDDDDDDGDDADGDGGDDKEGDTGGVRTERVRGESPGVRALARP
jgi:hypothetical protein